MKFQVCLPGLELMITILTLVSIMVELDGKAKFPEYASVNGSSNVIFNPNGLGVSV